MNIVKSEGFSFIEAIVTVCIISLLSLVPTVVFKGAVKEIKSKIYANKIIAVINKAKMVAIENRAKSVIYAGSGFPTQGNWNKGQFIYCKGKIFYKFSAVGNGYKLKFRNSFGSNNKIEFNPTGFTNGDQGSFYIFFDNKCLKKVIFLFSGRSRIEDC